jgi:hypothetical protein
VLKCHTHIHDAIWHAELGSGAAVLAAGYNLDCLMLRYQVQIFEWKFQRVCSSYTVGESAAWWACRASLVAALLSNR